jgi:hypothetical protein
MERDYNSQHGGNYGGEPAYRLQQASQPPTESSASDIDVRASQFLKKYDLQKKITRDLMCNRGGVEAGRFISQRALCDIWRDRLRDFLRILGYTDDLALCYIRDNLLKILSILVAIEWRQWNKFTGIFLASMHVPHACRLDESIPFTLEDLEQESFLGDRMGEMFFTTQYAFIPIVIEEGKVMEYPAWKRLPFIQSERKHLGKGSYGLVTKEVIAVNQFRWKDSQNLNDV